MSKEMILFSDLHLREESADICLNVLRGIRAEAVARGIVEIGFLGDFWHVRYVVPVRLLNMVKDEFHAWGRAGLRLHCLVGNHDQVDVNGRNALEVFDTFDHVSVYTQPCVNEWGLWIPYRVNEGDVREALAHGQMAKAEVIFAHLPLRGALMNSLIENTDGLEPEMFDGFRRVFLGHYHKRQALGRKLTCQYIGSPWQTRADEAGQEKGFAIWDGEDLELIDRVWGPQYRRFELMPGDRVELDVRPEDRVRVKVANETEAARVAAELARQGIRNAIVEPAAVNGTVPRLALGAGASFEAYARAYVNAEHKELEPATLMRVFEELTQ